MKTNYLVTEKAKRPASDKEQCFYCGSIIGDYHKKDCVYISKKVKVRAVIEYDIEVPSSWSAEDIEFHRNEGSWCSSNMLDELNEIDNEGCLCDKVKFEFIEEIPNSETFKE